MRVLIRLNIERVGHFTLTHGMTDNAFWRSTTDWISYDLRNNELKANTLRIILGAEKLAESKDKKAIEIDYSLDDIQKNQKTLSLKIVAKNGESTAAVYFARLLKWSVFLPLVVFSLSRARPKRIFCVSILKQVFV